MRTLPILLITACLLLSGAERRVVFPAGAKPVGPYSPGIFAGDYLYVSGQGARGADNKFSESSEDRIRQSLKNVQAIIEAGGLTMEHILYTQVYMHQSTTYDELNKVWREVFPKNPPARAVLWVHRMPTETPIEINAIAVKDLSRKQAVTVPGFPANSPIAAGIRSGDRLYISGLLGYDPATTKVPEDPAAQVELALSRVQSVLKAAGMDFRNMVFVNPYLTSAMPMGVMNKVYASKFEHGNTPARATIQVSGLAHGANIEFTGVAIGDLSKRRAIRPKNMPPSPTASPCVFMEDTLYCSAKSGFIPGPNGGIFAGTVDDQVRQTMRNLLDGLEEAGLNFSHVAASNVYVDNLDEFAKMNAVYGKYFPAAAPPSRTTVAPLAPVQRVRSDSGHFPKLEEVSIIAVQ